MRRVASCLVSLALGLAARALGGEAPLLKQVGAINLPDVKGRLDHMAVDVKGQRLFVAALANDSLEVIDLAAGKWVGRIERLRRPQGVLYIPDLDRLVVTNRAADYASIFEASSLKPAGQVPLRDNSNNVRYDPADRMIYIGCGGAEDGALAVIDAAKPAKIVHIPLAGHPEGFELETLGQRIFLNVPAAGCVQVVDRARRAVVANWPLGEVRGNFPMALDEENGRLFVGCRSPARLLVLATQTGKIVADLPCVADADEVFYDGRSKRIYVTGGGGSVAVVTQLNPDLYKVLGRVATLPGARTSLFVPETRTLYVAAPAAGGREAAILILKPGME